MTEIAVDAPADYRAALAGAVLYDEDLAGRMFLRGRDRAELLHRLSTNNITRLRAGDGTRTVLTTPIGRIIDLLSVHALEDALLVTTSPAQGPGVFAQLKKNIFFNDQVTLAPAGRSHAQWALYGAAAQDALASLAGAALAALPLHSIADATIDGAPVQIARRLPIGGQGFTLFVPAEHSAAVRAALDRAGVVPLSAATLDVLRVEQGYGAFGRELGQEYIPLETGLLDAVSFTKGCYVGQEIIARMESRGRLAKQLRGLMLRAEGRGLSAEEWQQLTQSAVLAPFSRKLLVDGKEAGDLTSVVCSPRWGAIALAYVRTAHAEPGALVGIAGSEVYGTVVALPFTTA